MPFLGGDVIFPIHPCLGIEFSTSNHSEEASITSAHPLFSQSCLSFQGPSVSEHLGSYEMALFPLFFVSEFYSCLSTKLCKAMCYSGSDDCLPDLDLPKMLCSRGSVSS